MFDAWHALAGRPDSEPMEATLFPRYFQALDGHSSMSIVTGLRFLHNARQIAAGECAMYLRDRNWNLAARRAFESIELTIKAAHFLLREAPRKRHDVGLPSADKLDFIPLVAWRSNCDPLSTVAVIVDRARELHDVTRMFKCVSGVLTLLSQSRGYYRANLQLEVDGSTLRLMSQGTKVASLTDTSHGSLLDGRWIQVSLTAQKLQEIDAARRRIGVERDGAFYLEHHVSQRDSELLVATASSIYSDVRKHAGYDISGVWTP